jgi:hypothetical protein
MFTFLVEEEEPYRVKFYLEFCNFCLFFYTKDALKKVRVKIIIVYVEKLKRCCGSGISTKIIQ